MGSAARSSARQTKTLHAFHCGERASERATIHSSIHGWNTTHVMDGMIHVDGWNIIHVMDGMLYL